MKQLFLLTALLFMNNISAQDFLNYQKPHADILDLVDVPLSPSTFLNNDQTVMLLLSRDAYKSIDALSKKELRLGGLRIDPKTNIGSRVRYFNNIQLRYLNQADQAVVQVKGLPAKAQLTNFGWSPDQSMMSLTNTTSTGVELWVIDIAQATARKISDLNLNANMRNVIQWFKDGKSLLVKVLPQDRQALIDTDQAVPTGPTISISDGQKAQNRTYQDLLKNKNDEFNFEQLSRSSLYKIDLNGTATKWMDAGMYSSISFSPDGSQIMIQEIHRPFSYIVPYYRFPTTTTIYHKSGKLTKTIKERALQEVMPKGFMSCEEGKRSFRWRADKPASLVYAVALDKGDPAVDVTHRDEVFQWDAPFTAAPKSLLKTINRFNSIMWARDDMAVAVDYWWNTRNTKTYLFNPTNANQAPRKITDRNYQDRYNDPGSFETIRNKYGRYVIALKDNKAFLKGDGYTKDGQFPFIDEFDFTDFKTKRIYTSKMEGKLERLVEYNAKDNQLLVKIESQNDFPNFYFRDLQNNSLKQLTHYKNPFDAIQNVHKELISYKREDGVELNGTLYLPVGYDREQKTKAPMILWAYPQEYKDKKSAGQKTSNPNAFIYPYWGSPIYWVNRGYVVLDDAAFPIIGEGDEEPNDSFRKQLVANAKAAIDAVNDLGYIDPERVAVGGHSYGAFMVANLLSHSDLFAAGIARSGAYNRTLTPFGFQSEERSYWEAPEVYYKMSPFMHADKMKTPLLLIHGDSDNNSGTYPLQSERYFNALKGLGATVRLVMLPKESHGYQAKESILHLLWEQDQWLEKYVKNRARSKN